MCEKVVVVIGASGELGKAVVKGLTERGMPLILLDKDTEVKKMEDENAGILAYTVDAGNEGLLADAVASGKERLGKPVGYLIYCAGIMGYGSVLEETAENYMEIFRENVVNPIIATKCLLPDMIKKQYGRILYVSSIFSEITRKNLSSYCISKAGLKVFMDITVKEYSEYNISANCVAPGPMRTKLIGKYLPSMVKDKSLVDSFVTLPKAFTSIKETARLCVSVLLDYEGINGQTIVIDNGYSKMA